MDNSKIQTLDDLIKFGNTSEYSLNLIALIMRENDKIFIDKLPYENYEHIIRNRCVKIKFEDDQWIKFRYKPALLSSTLYDTPNLHHLILYLNGGSEYKFTRKTITLLPPSDVAVILQEIVLREQRRINRSYLKAGMS